MSTEFHYEYPLGEFIRTCLKIDRLQSLFTMESNFQAQGNAAEYRNLLLRVLELHNLVARPELKNELIKEIEKRLLRLNKLKNIPGIDSSTLDVTLKSLSSTLTDLKQIPTDTYTLELPYILDTYKQRLSVPGGQFEFDLPAFQYWLNQDGSDCRKEILNAVSGFMPVITTIQLLLKLLRQSATAQTVSAENGIFQLTDNNDYDLIIISIPQKMNVFPEISGGRHRVFIRFLEFNSPGEKPLQTNKNLRFNLTCCRI